MASVSILTDLETDYLGELFNVGVGAAAAALSEMVDQEVQLSVPAVQCITINELTQILGEDQPICSVSQRMEGPFSGRALLLFPEDAGSEVVRRMLKLDLSDEDILDLQQEALSEVGNVVLNTCLGKFAESVESDFKIDLPQFELLTPAELLKNGDNSDDIVLFLNISLTLSESKIVGYLAIILGTFSLQQLKNLLERITNKLINK